MFAAAADWYYSWLEQGKRRNLTCLTIRGWSKHFFGSFVSTAVAAVAIAVVVVDAIVELGVVAADVDFVGETFVVASVIVVVVSAAAVVVAVDAIVVIVAVVSVVDVDWGFDFDAKVEEIVVVVASVSAVGVVAVDDIQEKQKRHQHVEI